MTSRAKCKKALGLVKDENKGQNVCRASLECSAFQFQLIAQFIFRKVRNQGGIQETKDYSIAVRERRVEGREQSPQSPPPIPPFLLWTHFIPTSVGGDAARGVGLMERSAPGIRLSVCAEGCSSQFERFPGFRAFLQPNSLFFIIPYSGKCAHFCVDKHRFIYSFFFRFSSAVGAVWKRIAFT